MMILGVGDGQGSLACCSPWGCNELDMTERVNWTETQPTGLHQLVTAYFSNFSFIIILLLCSTAIDFFYFVRALNFFKVKGFAWACSMCQECHLPTPGLPFSILALQAQLKSLRGLLREPPLTTFQLGISCYSPSLPSAHLTRHDL